MRRRRLLAQRRRRHERKVTVVDKIVSDALREQRLNQRRQVVVSSPENASGRQNATQ